MSQNDTIDCVIKLHVFHETKVNIEELKRQKVASKDSAKNIVNDLSMN